MAGAALTVIMLKMPYIPQVYVSMALGYNKNHGIQS